MHVVLDMMTGFIRAVCRRSGRSSDGESASGDDHATDCLLEVEQSL